jgi:hypothetical protein
MKRTKKNVRSLAERGEIAFRTAVANVVKQHRQAGIPLAIWQDGQVTLLPASKVKAPR